MSKQWGSSGWSARGFSLVLMLGLLAGCGSGERIYRLSGTVEFKGKPVPAGYIVFEPDTSKGNSGPAGRCEISKGKFDTGQGDGRGTVGGAHLVRIVGLSADPNANADEGKEVSLPLPLFPPYETTVELPMENSTQDFEVPAQ